MTTSAFLPSQPSQPYTKPTKAKHYKPTHPDLFKVEFSSANGTDQGPDEETYSSRLVAVREFPPNTVIAPLVNLSLAEEKAYSSVQYGVGSRDHFELNSDLLFMNHSCSPSVYLDLPLDQPHQWCIRTTSSGIQAGQPVTFFYPSTEWDMAQGFDCACGSKECLGQIRGAKYISLEDLEKRAPVNQHIKLLKAQQQEQEQQ
ncbi:hypothetical protein BD324DRAFT_678130 [Kockovaella imperatae]|uniref:Post-SET domain-containing protein n=1 Tax=Kockovaella imperatae TaxID=4999 RepID=A0A1Y1URK0_9TREE|nr:hypothetical protein BD324DRAFT_678130 [Kockovaella imperatae]ORX40688.1 hypothetical protein BD324DRAFT_678130 [Kockovaella imperatae]